MAGERLDPQYLYARMGEFAGRGLREGILSNFTIDGPVKNVPTRFHTFAGLFPQVLIHDKTFVVVSNDSTFDREGFYRKIAQLELAERVKRIRYIEDPPVRALIERRLAVQGLPSIMLGVGVTQDDQSSMISLFSIVGMKPENAYKEIQERIRSRLQP